MTSTRPVGGAFGRAALIIDNGSDRITGAQLAVAPDGAATIGWSPGPGGVGEALTRPPGGQWSKATVVAVPYSALDIASDPGGCTFAAWAYAAIGRVGLTHSCG